MRHYYVALSHGALLILADSPERAIEIASTIDDLQPEGERLTAIPLPDVTVVENDSGFQFRDLRRD